VTVPDTVFEGVDDSEDPDEGVPVLLEVPDVVWVTVFEGVTDDVPDLVLV
jgi:hypothetical protein